MDEATGQALDAVVDALRGHVDGEVVAAQMFQADGTWTGEASGGFFGKLFGKTPAAEPGEPHKFNLLALTEDRLHLFGCKPKSGRWVVTEPIGSWPLGEIDVRAHSKTETWTTHHHIPGPIDMSRSADTIKVAIGLRSEGRTLKLEGTVWEGDRLTQETVGALLTATGGR
jgi:hypothetical protein